MKWKLQSPASFRWIIGALIAGIACAAGLSLWTLRCVYHRQYHMTAASEVLQTGTAMATQLAEQPEVSAAGDVTSWRHFEGLLHSLWIVEPGLQYVAVTEDGVVLFHRQAGAAAPALSQRLPGLTNAPLQRAGGTVSVERKMLRLGTNDIPIVSFTKSIAGDNGTTTVEVALREESVARAASGPVAATTAMFHVAVVTVAVAFGFCMVLVVWVMRREDLAERHRRAQEHLSFAGAMASGVVHDFRNPLSSVKLDIQMLREEADAAPPATATAIKDLADHAVQTAGRMEEILEQFLSLASPREESRERVDLAACVHECLRMLQPRLSRHDVHVRTRLPGRAVHVLAFGTSLRRALLNILNNAEQHSPRGGWIEVRLQASSREVVLEVEDSGPGIPRTEWQRVFAMFVSGRPGGTGLGLFLARTAVERCEGTLELVEPGAGGTCFRMTLKPALEPESEESP